MPGPTENENTKLNQRAWVDNNNGRRQPLNPINNQESMGGVSVATAVTQDTQPKDPLPSSAIENTSPDNPLTPLAPDDAGIVITSTSNPNKKLPLHTAFETQAMTVEQQQQLRLQKIAQQYATMRQQNSAFEPIENFALNQEKFIQLFKDVEEEINKFQQDANHRPGHKHPGEYNSTQLNDFETSTKTFYTGIKKKAVLNNNFQIIKDDISTVNVSFSAAQNPKDNLIKINGNQDNIAHMLVTAMLAKKKLGANVQYVIYPSKDLPGMAELFARAKICGLNPIIKDFPDSTDSEKTAADFTDDNGNKKAEFDQLVATYTEKYQFSEEHKRPKTTSNPESPTGSPAAAANSNPASEEITPTLTIRHKKPN